MKYWKSRSIIIVLAIVLLIPVVSLSDSADRRQRPDSCTSIMVGRKASTDGSTITAHTCDGPYRTWVEIVPGKEHGGDARTAIYTGKHWTRTPDDRQSLKETGEIPQAERTYSFLNTSYPAMNEHQLAMGETTIIANRLLKSNKGLFLIEELQRVALQRCTTAREAIRLMGDLIRDYGYIDGAECLTIIDPREVWMFEVYGPGLGNQGGVWAAARIPDDHVGVSANSPRIGRINLDNPDYFMASDNIYSQARELKLWDGNEPFEVSRVYGDRSEEGRKRYLKYCRLREWWVLNALAPSLKLDAEAGDLPFSVKPDHRVSVRKVMDLYRAHYAGTPYDMIQNLGRKDPKTGTITVSNAVHPWINRRLMALFNDLVPGVIDFSRYIAINYCAYSTVIQSRSWLPDPVGGITWLAFDNPALAVRIPVFAGTRKLLDEFHVSNQKGYRTDSAAWAYRRAIRLSQPRWDKNRAVMEGVIKEYEDKAFHELPGLEERVTALLKEDREKALEVLTDYVLNFSRMVLRRYWELGDSFWPLYTDGF